jgi:hypothetical protein
MKVDLYFHKMSSSLFESGTGMLGKTKEFILIACPSADYTCALFHCLFV